MEKEKLEVLAAKYLKGTATDEEKQQLHEWYDDWQDEVQYIHDAGSDSQAETGQRLLLNLQRDIRDRAAQSIQVLPGVRERRRRLTMAVAAAIIGLAGIACYLVISRSRHQPHAAPAMQQLAFKNDVKPGGNKAVLTLANGRSIVLDSAANGPLAQQGNVKVIKLANGQLVYQPAGGSQGRIDYNTMTIPRGGQYKLALPDGTNVWLNAASSITYPTAFAGKERKVSITGEAYFEVAKNTSMPFIVATGDAVVQVLGTSFNVNAYGDDHRIRTTLLEGSVKVRKGDGNVLLQPGEQAGVMEAGNIQVCKVDVDEVVAWKNGVFQFSNSSIENIMHQLARWYDLEVVYEGKIPTDRFNGEVPRSVNVSVILSILQASGTKFRIDGKKIVVLP